MRKDMINKTALRQSAILFAAALIWGFTFVAQSVGMDYVGPFTFIAARNIVALLVLLPMAVVLDRRGKRPQTGGRIRGSCLSGASAAASACSAEAPCSSSA